VPYLFGNRDLREPHSGDLGDMQGEIPHPLEIGYQVGGRYDHAQIRGYWLLPSDDLEGALVELLAQRVDVRGFGDDSLGTGEVTVEQCVSGTLHGLLDQLGHGLELLTDLVQLVVVDIAHLMSIPLRFLAREPVSPGRTGVV